MAEISRDRLCKSERQATSAPVEWSCERSSKERGGIRSGTAYASQCCRSHAREKAAHFRAVSLSAHRRTAAARSNKQIAMPSAADEVSTWQEHARIGDDELRRSHRCAPGMSNRLRCAVAESVRECRKVLRLKDGGLHLHNQQRSERGGAGSSRVSVCDC